MGGLGNWDAPDGQVDGARAPRSPGSTLKPFAYAAAFEGGLSPADVLADIPRTWATTHGTWTPTNYSGRHRGPVRAREALACSINLPAVEVTEKIGVASLLDRLHRAGITTLEASPRRYGLGLVLGDGEVRLDELTGAYAALARGGRWVEPTAIVRDRLPEAVLVTDPASAWLVANILSDPVARAPAFGRWGPLERDYPAAAKTGTSSNFRDNWTVGFTSEWAVGVWVGNFDGRPMGSVTGVTGAAPLWGAVMDRVTGGRAELPTRPDGLVLRQACALSGHRPGEHCAHVVEDWYRVGHVRRPRCDWHAEVEVDPTTGARATGCPGAERVVRVRWPARFRPWAQRAGLDRWPEGPGCVPPEPTAPAQVAIAAPADGVAVHIDRRRPRERQRIALRAATPAGSRRATWRVDGEVLAEIGPPFEALWLPESGGLHKISLTIDGTHARPVSVWVGGLDAPPGGG